MIHNKRISRTVCMLAAIGAMCVCKPQYSNPDELYGTLSAGDYLIGNFDPATQPLFLNVNTVNIKTMGRTIYLRREAAEALNRMIADFKKEHPDVDLWVVSGTRNFASQKGIWEGKWNGTRAVNGQQLNRTIPDGRQRALKILEYSSMPGTSRHHWGTDFDINILQNDYYKRGPGLEIYAWLQSNAHKYGFCQPYTAGREAGYNEERWHWSYVPLSSIFLRDWNDTVKPRYPLNLSFDGVGSASDLASVYVNSVDESCK